MAVQVGGAGCAGSHHTHRDRGHQNGEDDGVAKGEWRSPRRHRSNAPSRLELAACVAHASKGCPS